MAISLSRVQDLLDSNGRILMQMVLVFYPSVTVPCVARTILLFNLVMEKMNHQIKWLQSWIVVVMSKIQKALMLFWQSTIRPLLDPIIEKMRAIWDPIAEKMNNLSEALKMYLTNDAVMGQPKVKLIGRFALLFAKILLQDSELRLQYDKNRVISWCFVICYWLLSVSDCCGKKLKILCRRLGCIANSTSNFTWFILALLFETYYDKSLKNLGVAFCMTIFNLSLLVVLRAQTDFGFFGFIIGVVGSITYNRFGLKFPSWIVACICYLIFCLKSWLEKHWLDFEEDMPLPSTCTIGCAFMMRRFPQSCLLLGLSLPRREIQPQLLGQILSFVGAVHFTIHFWDGIRKGAPKDDYLPPYTRFTRRTHYVYYRFMICSSALDFLYVLGTSVATYVPWLNITLLMLIEMSIYGYRYMSYV